MTKLLSPIFLLAICGIVAANEIPLDLEYAESQPLATRSMLLDITRIEDHFVAVGERGHVIVSTDGDNWSQAEHVPTRSTLTSVFAAGGRLWAGGHDTVLLTSGDHGQTWSQQHFDPDRQQAFMDILFTDGTYGVAIGSYGLYLKTGDGGQTWQDELIDPESDYHLNSMVRFADGRRMIAGEAGYSYRSFDDGVSWEALDLPYVGSMWGAILLQNGCVVFYGLRGHAMESCDFGSSWAELETGTEASLSGAAEDDGLLVLVGNSGTILTRQDGRIAQHVHSSGVDFSAVLALGEGRFLLVGEEGVHRFPEQGKAEDRP
jgi:photosystem II stability/assembly factor-like uncharacterized protein